MKWSQGFIKSSNDIISGELDETPPNHDKVSGEIESENKINDSDMEISEDDGVDTQVDENREYDV